ncbi:MAG: DNA mismatch repair endonuclease MutL [Pirellulales bacterium]
MPCIQQLPASVVNKIAAGEVIERPASLVKELMENSLDAGATRIDVSLEQGGSELVRVVDDGAGIPAGELPLAVASHATSKLVVADDLFRVRTLGFRGEALASMAEVSRLTLRSRPRDGDSGAEIEVAAGQASAVTPCGCPVGTAVEVRNLFFNTPVRRKFLRSIQTEVGHVSESFIRLALAHPAVHMTLKHNRRTVYELPPAGDWRERIGHFFGRELADDLLWVQSSDGDVRLAGYVGHPNQSRPNARMQYLFLNGRSIRDRSLSHALGEAYRGLLLTGRFPVSFLRIEMPPELVDVNVHPTKLEVRFQDGGRLYSQLLGTLRTRFLTTDLTHRLNPAHAPEAAQAHDPARAAQLRGELVDWAKGQVAGWQGGEGTSLEQGAAAGLMDGGGQDPGQMGPPAQPAAGTAGFGASSLAMPAGFGRAQQGRFELNMPEPAGEPLKLNRLDPARAAAAHRPHSAAGAKEAADAGPANGRTGRVAALQVHNRYLLAESEEGVLVIDQHALHERILYEQLRETVLAGTLESQALLVPEPVDLSAAEAAAVLEQRQLLARLGVVVEPFGGDTVLVSSYPAMLRGSGVADILRRVVEHLVGNGRPPDERDLVDELLHMFACKAAIKAGDRLSADEIEALLQQRHLARDTHHCPHGRPTALLFTREDLDRQFKRT